MEQVSLESEKGVFCAFLNWSQTEQKSNVAPPQLSQLWLKGMEIRKAKVIFLFIYFLFFFLARFPPAFCLGISPSPGSSSGGPSPQAFPA